MLQRSPILQTKISPPPLTARTLARKRVVNQILEAHQHRQTILQAGARYGKSTALSTIDDGHRPLIWYQVSKEGNDLVVFLLHLCYATRLALPEIRDLPIPILEAWDATREPFPFQAVVYQFLNALNTIGENICLVSLGWYILGFCCFCRMGS